jgi:hypothetical protein
MPIMRVSLVGAGGHQTDRRGLIGVPVVGVRGMRVIGIRS